MPSFDVVSKVNVQEVTNAVHNASKEIVNRFDFKNTKTEIEWTPDQSLIVITSTAEGRVIAAYDVLLSKLVKRNVSLKCLKPGEIKTIGGGRVRQDIPVQQGIEQELAKKIIKDIKQNKQLRIQGAIQGDQLRFTGKKRDDLQAVIAELKAAEYDVSLQYVNFRD